MNGIIQIQKSIFSNHVAQKNLVLEKETDNQLGTLSNKKI